LKNLWLQDKRRIGPTGRARIRTETQIAPDIIVIGIIITTAPHHGQGNESTVGSAIRVTRTLIGIDINDHDATMMRNTSTVTISVDATAYTATTHLIRTAPPPKT
jgi:hypothetical protein